MTIRFVTEASHSPFAFNEGKALQGFDIDLATALVKHLGEPCTFTERPFDALIPALTSGRCDAAIAALHITEERLKAVAFTKPYFDDSATFIARKGTVPDQAALRGKVVGVTEETTHQQFLMCEHPEITVTPYEAGSHALLELKSGRLDAVLTDTAVANAVHEAGQMQVQLVGGPVTEGAYFGRGIGIAVNLANAELLSRFNSGLEALKADGTYQSISQKWFRQ